MRLRPFLTAPTCLQFAAKPSWFKTAACHLVNTMPSEQTKGLCQLFHGITQQQGCATYASFQVYAVRSVASTCFSYGIVLAMQCNVFHS